MEAKKKGRRRSLRILSCITSSADPVSNDVDLTGQAYGTVWLPDQDQATQQQAYGTVWLPDQDQATQQQALDSRQSVPLPTTDTDSAASCQTPASEDNVTTSQPLSDYQPQRMFPTPEQLRQCPYQPQEDSFSATPVHLCEWNMTGQTSQDSDFPPKSFCGDTLYCSSKNRDNGLLDSSSPTVDFLIQNTVLGKTNTCSVSSTDNEDSGICSVKEVLATTLPSPYNMLSDNSPVVEPDHTMVSCLDELPIQTQSETMAAFPDTVSSQKVSSFCPDTVDSSSFTSSSQAVLTACFSAGIASRGCCQHSPELCVLQQHQCHRDNSGEELCHKDTCGGQEHDRHSNKEQEYDRHSNKEQEHGRHNSKEQEHGRHSNKEQEYDRHSNKEQEHDRHSSKEQEHHKNTCIEKELSSTCDCLIGTVEKYKTHSIPTEVSQLENGNDVSLTEGCAQTASSPDVPLWEKSLASASGGQTTPKMVLTPSHTDHSAEIIDIVTVDRLSTEFENVPVVTNMGELQSFESDSAQLVKSLGSQSHSSCPALTMKSNKEAAKRKKQRRRSAFGAELQLGDMHALQVQDELNHSTDINDGDSVASAYTLEECPQQVQEADCLTQTQIPVSPHFQTETAGTSCVCDTHDKAVQGAECVGENHAGKSDGDIQPVVSKKTRIRKKRRVSADISVIADVMSSAEDLHKLPVPEPPGLELAASAFKRRRSSLRLYRHHAAASSGDQTKSHDLPNLPASGSSTKQNDANTSDCVVKCVMSADTGSSTKQGDSATDSTSPDSCDPWNESGNAISQELEQIYRNKNYKIPAEKAWETIYECPSKGKITSKQKMRRFLQFTDRIPVFKLKRRMKKASQNGWHAASNRLTHVDDEQMKQKLQQLDQEMINL